MTPRDADCARLAAAMGWRYLDENYPFMPNAEGAFVFVRDERDGMETWIHLPAPDAPLGDRMRFVGELAEALGCKWGDIEFSAGNNVVIFRTPFNAHQFQGEAPDLAHAAVRAAIAAKGATT